MSDKEDKEKIEKEVIDAAEATINASGSSSAEEEQVTEVILPYIALPYQKMIGRDKHRFITVVASRRVGKCRDAESLIQLGDGRIVKAKELIDQKFELVGVDKNGDFNLTSAYAQDNGVKPVYRVITATGREIEVTDNHPLLTLFGWKEASKLEIGDRIAAPKFLPIKGKKEMDINLVKVLAYMLGDGNFTNATPRFSQEDNGQLKEFKKCIHKLGGIVSYVSGYDYYVKGLNELFKQYGLDKYAYEKEIPQEITELNDIQLAIFLSRLFSTDGWFYQHKTEYNKNDYEIGYCSTSRVMISQIQTLLLRFGIKSSIKEKKANELTKHTAYQLTIQMLDDVRRFGDTIGIYYKMPRQKFLDGKKQPTKSALLMYNHNNWFYDAVKQVEYLGERSTVAITVPDGNVYADKFIEHNTVMAINKLLEWALTRDVPSGTPFWLVGPYFHQVKTIAWTLLLRYVPQILWSRKPNESSLTMYLINGNTITLKGSDNPFALEGTALGGLIVDEISAISQWQQLWNYTLRPMLADYQSPAMFISKPRGFNHFHDLAKMGDHNRIIEGEARPGVVLDKDFMTYRFETEINCKEHNSGYIAHDEIETARRTLPPAAFDQEWLGKFTKFTGLVHQEFDREIHVIPDVELPHSWRRVYGADFGSNHPTGILRIALDPDDNFYVEHCYKQRDKHISEIAEVIKGWDKDWLDMDGRDPIQIFADPSGRAWIKEYCKLGLSMRRATKSENTTDTSWIQLCIDLINAKLAIRPEHTVFLPNESGEAVKIEGAPSFFILNREENYQLVSEFETLGYKDSAAGTNRSELDDALDTNGHFDLDAALRYLIISVSKKISYATLYSPQQDEMVMRTHLQQQKQKPIYIPASVNLNDASGRAQLEKELDLEIVRNQGSGFFN